MALKEIIYLTPTQFNTLVTTGSLTVGGVVYTFDPDTTDYRVKYTEPTIPVKGVQINATDLTPDAQGKVNIPKASDSALGVVKGSATYGTGVGSSGQVYLVQASDAEVQSKSNQYKPITPSNLQLAVDTGVKGSTNYTSFTVEKSDGTTGTLKIFCELS